MTSDAGKGIRHHMESYRIQDEKRTEVAEDNPYQLLLSIRSRDDAWSVMPRTPCFNGCPCSLDINFVLMDVPAHSILTLSSVMRTSLALDSNVD